MAKPPSKNGEGEVADKTRRMLLLGHRTQRLLHLLLTASLVALIASASSASAASSGKHVKPFGNDQCKLFVGPTRSFSSIQVAINSLGRNKASRPLTVCVDSGLYNERVRIGAGLDGITLVGNGAGNTIISSATSKSATGNPWLSATLTVTGNRFTARQLAVQNTFKSVSDPCPAVAILSNETTWDGVALSSWDDTLGIYTGTSHLFTNCVISGLTDMTWGFGRVAFVQTTFNSQRWSDKHTLYTGDLATFGSGEDAINSRIAGGALFWQCTLQGDGQTFLGRPYRPVTTVVFVACYMGSAVQPAGWDDYQHNLMYGKFNFREYNSIGSGAASSRRAGQVLTGNVPQQYTVQGFIGRTA